MKREIASRVALSVGEPATLVFSVAVAADYAPVDERLSITLGGAPLVPTEVLDLHGTRLHRVEAGVDQLDQADVQLGHPVGAGEAEHRRLQAPEPAPGRQAAALAGQVEHRQREHECVPRLVRDDPIVYAAKDWVSWSVAFLVIVIMMLGNFPF